MTFKRDLNLMQVILAPSANLAQEFMGNTMPDATVEAEYGGIVKEGSLVTFAHHSGEWQKCPPPCLQPNRKASAQPIKLAMISHIDLDTVMGLMALEGCKPKNTYFAKAFYRAAGFIDLNGYHNLFQVSKRSQQLLNAANAYFKEVASSRYSEVTDVTDVYRKCRDFLIDLLSDYKFRMQAIETGEAWSNAQIAEIDACLVDETANVRVFESNGVFCNAAYYSHIQNRLFEACAVWNTKLKTVTVSFANVAELAPISARDIVQSLWGPEAGGHNGIAGSPRGVEMTANDLQSAVTLTQSLIEQRLQAHNA